MADRSVAASLSAYEPSWRERVGNATYDIARYLGLGSTANRMRNDVETAVDFVPLVGDAIGFNDAMNDFNAGNYGMAAAGLGLAALGGIPMVGDAVAAGGRKILSSSAENARVLADMLASGRANEITNDMISAADPSELWKLYESGATGVPMPMDQASRMARAREMGFDTDTPLYHETGKNFGAFDTGVVGARATDSDLPNGVFLKPNGKSIGLGGDGEVQMPVLARMGKTEDLIDRRHAQSFFGQSDEYRTARKAVDNYETRMARDYDARFEGPVGQEWLNRDADNYFAESDKFLAEWNAGNVDRASAARSAADDFLTSEGVDALRIAQDQGSLGRSVQTTIVRDPANIRSQFARFDPRLKHLSHLSAGLAGAVAAGTISLEVANQMQELGQDYQP